MSKWRDTNPDIRTGRFDSTREYRVQDTSQEICHQCAAWINDLWGVVWDFGRSSVPLAHHVVSPDGFLNRVYG